MKTSISLDRKAIRNLLKVQITSSMSDKYVVKTYNVNSQLLKKWKKEYKPGRIVVKDRIYGWLRQNPGLHSIDEITLSINRRSKKKLTQKITNKEVQKLVNEGLAYLHNDKVNFVQRLVEVFSIKTEKLVKEVELAHFDLKRCKIEFKPKRWDYLMFEVFDILPAQTKFLAGGASLDFDFEKYTYDLACVQGA